MAGCVQAVAAWVWVGGKTNPAAGNSLDSVRTHPLRVVLFPFGAPTPPTITPDRERRYPRAAVHLCCLTTTALHITPAHWLRRIGQILDRQGRVQGF